MQLSQVIDGFFIVRRTRLAPTTQTNYRYCFKRLTNFLGTERDLLLSLLATSAPSSTTYKAMVYPIARFTTI